MKPRRIARGFMLFARTYRTRQRTPRQKAIPHVDQTLLDMKHSTLQMKQDLPHVEQAFLDVKQTSPTDWGLGVQPQAMLGKGWGLGR